MWCKRCQQDAPGIANGEGGMACARCGSTVRTSPTAAGEKRSADEMAALASAALADDAPTTDTWQLDAELTEAERLLAAFSPLAVPADASLVIASQAARTHRFDPEVKRRDELEKPPAIGGFVAWILLLAGTMALVCGGVLIGWSLYAGRAALWNLGLPILLAGQAGLLLGVVLQLVRIWQNHRAAAERLAAVDRQLGDLEQTTTLLGNTYGAGSSTFFAHLAEGASPHLLLADLKGQMDLLAMKMSGK
ncbi:MAG: hypothetical protein DCC68_13235 [Planctomycetota bacterium]|nr:MAG: hypothetical protein DCC68_13235 [Planctomycetota bacterium]